MTLNDLKDLGSEDKNEGKDTALYLRDALKTRTSPWGHITGVKLAEWATLSRRAQLFTVPTDSRTTRRNWAGRT